jgi:hypothetical protein
MSDWQQRLTKSPAPSYFSAKLRFAVQELRALTGLPKTLALLTTLLMALFAVGAGSIPAAAHGNHSHQVAANTSNTVVSVLTHADMQLMAMDLSAEASHASQPALPDEHRKSDCCCGTIMCHAGVTLAFDCLPFPYPTGVRLIAEPTSGRPQRDASGLDRPPRTTYIA